MAGTSMALTLTTACNSIQGFTEISWLYITEYASGIRGGPVVRCTLSARKRRKRVPRALAAFR
jgi:hypothetical protein